MKYNNNNFYDENTLDYPKIEGISEAEYRTIFINKIIESLVKGDTIDIKDKNRNEIIMEIYNIIDDLEFISVIDYRDSILDEARKYYSEEKLELSYLLYATWFEHWINGVISILGLRRNFNEKDVNDMIRNISLKGKYTWLLQLFEVEELDDNHLNLIFSVLRLRNSFVHYNRNEKDRKISIKENNIMEKIEKVVRYLEEIEDKVVYKGNKEKLNNL